MLVLCFTRLAPNLQPSYTECRGLSIQLATGGSCQTGVQQQLPAVTVPPKMWQHKFFLSCNPTLQVGTQNACLSHPVLVTQLRVCSQEFPHVMHWILLTPLWEEVISTGPSNPSWFCWVFPKEGVLNWGLCWLNSLTWSLVFWGFFLSVV